LEYEQISVPVQVARLPRTTQCHWAKQFELSSGGEILSKSGGSVQERKEMAPALLFILHEYSNPTKSTMK
jgi:hypothetical protein